MMKDLMFQQQQQQQQPLIVEENMSNLTSASGEASVSSSSNRIEIGTSYPQQHLPPPPTLAQPPKKKRNLPGNPDPDAEVIALSPKSLLAKNRFICEICNKGFQRDQNLQLHRRGHNLPWKLKQRTSKEVRKKVYVCPEPSCVHHDPSRALGDLTGIKKHFSRKHGEKKWKCDKCSKRYAVQSDWKAHSKTCGTREYRCDCGTLFSRRDSFITHRAFCDALAEESGRANMTGTVNNSLLPSQQHPSSSSHHINLQPQFNNIPHQDLHHANFPLKKEQHQSFNIPPWLGPPMSSTIDLSSNSNSSIFSPRMNQQEFSQTQHHNQDLSLHENPNPSLVLPATTTLPGYQPPPHMSATALLQKAAQMGSTMSRPHQQQDHVTADSTANNTIGLNLSSCDTLLHDVINSFSSSSSAGFEGSSFEDAFGGILNSKKDYQNLHDTTLSETTTATRLGRASADVGGGGGGGGNEGLTRDFLGLRPLSHSDILSIAGIGNCMNDQQNQSQKPWQG